MATAVAHHVREVLSTPRRWQARLIVTQIPLPVRRRLAAVVTRVLFPPGNVRWRRLPRRINQLPPAALICPVSHWALPHFGQV